MSKAWPLVKLGEVLVERQEAPDSIALDNGEIKVVSKIGFNKGEIEFRTDSQTKTGMILIYPGDLVISGINAAKGAIAIYDEKQSNTAAATIHYGSYSVKRERADINFLWWLLRSNTFKEILNRNLPGGIKTELKAKRLLPIEIPLPPLAEQQQIVAKIERLAGKIEEANQLRQKIVEEMEAFTISTHINFSGTQKKMIGDFFKLDEDKELIIATREYPQVGVKSFGGGLFPKSAVKGTETSYKNFNRLYDGAVVLSQVKGWEGAIAVCDKNLAGWYVSPEYRTFRCIPNEALPGYMATLVRTEWFWKHLKNATRGVGARRERTRPEQFLTIKIPMPDTKLQKLGQQLFTKMEISKQVQAQTAVELDALLPSILDKAFKGEL